MARKEPFGRPTKYKEEYCEMLYQHMKGGLSFESFAGQVGVCFETLYAWEKKHENFLKAKLLGKAGSMLFWEEMGRSGAAGKLAGFNYGCWFRNMTNRFGHQWREKQEIIHRDETFKDPSEMSDEELSEKIVHALEVIEKYENESKSSKAITSRISKAKRKKATTRKRKTEST